MTDLSPRVRAPGRCPVPLRGRRGRRWILTAWIGTLLENTIRKYPGSAGTEADPLPTRL